MLYLYFQTKRNRMFPAGFGCATDLQLEGREALFARDYLPKAGSSVNALLQQEVTVRHSVRLDGNLCPEMLR
jgi:hypothetical protein